MRDQIVVAATAVPGSGLELEDTTPSDSDRSPQPRRSGPPQPTRGQQDPELEAIRRWIERYK